MILFFDKDIKAKFSEFSFSKEESKHLTKVLRKKLEIKLRLPMETDWNGKVS